MAEGITDPFDAFVGSSRQYERVEPYIRITVSNPQKVGDFVFSHITYRVNTVTNYSGFESDCISVSRRYKDFLHLYIKLVDKYKHEGRIVPPPPEKDFGGMLSVMVANEHLAVRMQFVQKRMSALERFVSRVAAHPILREDSCFRDFLQMKTEFYRSVEYKEENHRGNFFNLFSDSSLFRGTVEERNEWFRRKPELLESFQLQLKRFFVAIKDVIAQRQNLSMSTAHMARSISMLSSFEENELLSRTLVAAAELQDDIEKLYETQACSEDLLLPELIKDYVHFTDFVKDVFDERLNACKHLQDAERELEKRETAELRARENSLGVNALRKAIKQKREWQEKVERHTQICNRISTVLQEEINHYEKIRAAEFKVAFFKWAHIYVDIEEQVMNNCKEFLRTEDETQ